jgi:4-amino-4-deoxy-L-arabinose transferase-like glycosyltransferase
MRTYEQPGNAMKHARVLTAVFVIALVLRCGVAIWLPKAVIWPDGERYERVALNLLHGEGFGSLSDNRQSVPTQPLLIAGVYKVFGQNYLALRLLFAVLGSASCVLGAILAQRLLGSGAGFVAGFLLAGYPLLVYLQALFEYPQGFFILLMALFFLLYYRFLATGSNGLLFLSAATLGLAVLTVPTVLIFVAAWCLLLLTRNLRETAIRLAVVGLAMTVTVGSWTYRNYAAYDTPILVNKAAGFQFWTSNNDAYFEYGKPAVTPACAEGYESTKFCVQYRELNLDLDRRQLDGVERVLEFDRVSWRHSFDFIRESPGRFALLIPRKFADFWRPTPDAVHQGREYGGAARDVIAIATYIPMVLLALIGLIITRNQWRHLAPVYLYVVTFVLPYAVFIPATRYRIPIDFILIMFSADALFRGWTFFSRRTHQELDATSVVD